MGSVTDARGPLRCARSKDSRRYPKYPLLGVGALIFRRGSILLVERGREPLKGYWSLPGGVLEVGEKLADGLSREVLEETGLAIEPLSVVEIFERIMRDAVGVAEGEVGRSLGEFDESKKFCLRRINVD